MIDRLRTIPLLAPFARAETYRALLYALAGVVLGSVALAVLLAGWIVTIVFAITPLVFPLLFVLRWAVGLVAAAQAGLANGLLGTRVTPALHTTRGASFWSRALNVLRDAAFWKQQAYLLADVAARADPADARLLVARADHAPDLVPLGRLERRARFPRHRHVRRGAPGSSGSGLGLLVVAGRTSSGCTRR